MINNIKENKYNVLFLNENKTAQQFSNKNRKVVSVWLKNYCDVDVKRRRKLKGDKHKCYF